MGWVGRIEWYLTINSPVPSDYLEDFREHRIQHTASIYKTQFLFSSTNTNYSCGVRPHAIIPFVVCSLGGNAGHKEEEGQVMMPIPFFISLEKKCKEHSLNLQRTLSPIQS
jgi:hypothetical protein